MALIEKLKNIANAIRSKTNKSEEMTLEQMASEVEGIDTLQGFDFSEIYDKEQAEELNQYYKDGIEKAPIETGVYENINLIYCTKELFEKRKDFFMSCVRLQAIDKRCDFSKLNSLYYLFCYCGSLWDIGEIDAISANNAAYTFFQCRSLSRIVLKNTQNILTFANTFNGCSSLNYISPLNLNSCTSFTDTFTDCFNLEQITLYNTNNVTNFTRCAYNVRILKTIHFGSIRNAITTAGMFQNSKQLECVFFSEWKSASISIGDAPNLTPESIHYIIQNAMNVADGATARTLTLHATAKTNWQNSEYYEQDLAVLEQKGITIA